MADAARDPSRLLLNASVLVFLFRAMAATRIAAKRDQVSKQLLSLLREFVLFESGEVLLGHTEDELAALRGR
jgi:hypothetical protein